MVVTAHDLDREIKSNLRDLILKELFTTYGSLPLPNEQDKIDAVITVNLTARLQKEIKEYYNGLFGDKDSIECSISDKDYVDIYLNRI